MQFSFANQGLQWSDAWFLLEGAGRSIQMAIASALIGTLLGILLGWLRSVSLLCRVVTAPYIDVLRSVPMLIQLILANSALSMLGFPTSTFWFGVVALSMWMSAVTAEVTRAALDAVPAHYVRSARSLGMTYGQQLRHISLPIAIRTGFAPWVNLLLSLTKDSSLAGIIGYMEFTRSSQILMTRTHETWLLLFGMGLFYFAICYPISRASRAFERRTLA